jgi:uncharacterized protein YjbI with pentapeptide repeats
MHHHLPLDRPAGIVTEQYDDAVARLSGSEAAQRLAGLYRLDQIARLNPAHRQTVMDVLCGYLRRPYSTPSARDSDAEPARELYVRVAAQRLLATNLRMEDAHHGFRSIARYDIDLTGAVLHELDLRGCRARLAIFAGATFLAGACFASTSFASADFRKTLFNDGLDCAEMRITGVGRFSDAILSGPATFAKAAFGTETWFDKAEFLGPTTFESTTYKGPVAFRSAKFHNAARFGGSVYLGAAWFDRAYFAGDLWLQHTVFHGPAYFDRNEYYGGVHFQSATFNDVALFDTSTFRKGALFRNDTFHRPSLFRDIRFFGHVDLSCSGDLDLTGSVATTGPTTRRRWPDGWAAIRDRRRNQLRLVSTR